MVAVRRLGSGDLPAFRAMNALFATVFAEPQNYAETPPTDTAARRWLAQAHHVAITAEQDGETLGALAGYLLDKFEQERRELFIYDLAVAEMARRRGIASAMIEEARRVARAAGAWTIFVQADDFKEDAPARALYRSFAREHLIAHHYDIEP